VVALLLFNLACAAFKSGSWQEAADYSGQCLSMLDAIAPDEVPKYTGVQVRLYLGSGEREQAAALLPPTEVAVRLSSEMVREHFELLAELAVLDRDWQGALAAATRGLEALSDTSESAFTGRLLLLALRALADGAERGRALREARVQEPVAAGERLRSLALDQPDGPLGAKPADYVVTNLAVRAQWTAEWERLSEQDSVRVWALAAAEWRSLDRSQPLAYCLLMAGKAALRAGQKPAAAEYLSEAVGIAERLGARPITDEAHAVASRGRLRLTETQQPTTPETSAPYGLTARELEVLALLAQGLTNRQIGKELYISPHTVGVHVSRVLMKLEVSSRTQAATIATALGLSPTAS
jgi:DNA-binding CsgD family transcriptional regulator